jgi:hypothetical protein
LSDRERPQKDFATTYCGEGSKTPSCPNQYVAIESDTVAKLSFHKKVLFVKMRQPLNAKSSALALVAESAACQSRPNRKRKP